MLGALLALASAATFGLNNAALRRGILSGSVLQAMGITVPIGVPLFFLACLVFGGFQALSSFTSSQWIWMAGAGIVHFIIGRYGNYRSTKGLGANLSGPIQQLSVPISIVLAIIYLGETLTPVRLIGFMLVMLGPVVMLRCKNTHKTKSGFIPNYNEGFVWGFVSAFAYGISPIFIMKGLGTHGGLADSVAGGFISYSTAAIIVLILIMFCGGIKFMSKLDSTASKWFITSGVLVFFSQMFRYMSLAIAPITVVVPIQRLSPVFRVIFSWILNRDHEVFGFWVLLGISISMFGAILLTLSTDLVISLLPDNWAPIISIKWP